MIHRDLHFNLIPIFQYQLIAWYDGASWQKHEVDDSAANHPSLAFNEYGNGFPVISYLDNTGNLYFVEDPPAEAPEPATLALFALGGLVALGRSRRTRRGDAS